MTETKETYDLTKLTATKLREIAMEYPEIQGAHAMKKEELIMAICKARGEPLPSLKKGKEKKGGDIKKIKQEIQALKAEKAKALEARDKELLKKLRQKIKRLKRETRRAAATR